MSVPYRIAEKFESADATRGFWFPHALYEWGRDQELGAPFVVSPGADYAFDYLGASRGPKALAREDVRFAFAMNGLEGLTWSEIPNVWGSFGWTSWGIWGASVEDALALIQAEIGHIGRGKLWTLGRDGTRRWAWARPTRMPQLQIRSGNLNFVPAALSFLRESDWFGETLTEGDVVVSAATTAVVITNPGDAPVRDAVLTLAGTFTNPTITNTTTGESVATSLDGAAAADVLRIDAGRYAVEFSDDGGDTFDDDYASATLGATQVALVTLEPGDNNFTITSSGTPSATFGWSFYPAYH